MKVLPVAEIISRTVGGFHEIRRAQGAAFPGWRVLSFSAAGFFC